MNWVRDRFRHFDQQVIAVNETGSVTYSEFLQKIDDWHQVLQKWDIKAGDRVGLVSDYHIDVVALVQALLETACIIIPLSLDDQSLFEERLDTAFANKLITITNTEEINVNTINCQTYNSSNKQMHPLMQSMLFNGTAGFVIYTSGSTGKSKAVLLDYSRMIEKYRDKIRKPYKTLLFLKFDHIGGLDTLFLVILSGGTIVTTPSRQVEDICRCIEKYSVELLPTTPSFLNMLLMSNVYKNYNLSSLKLIAYGSEMMPHSTLTNLSEIFPCIQLKQTYGLSEMGVFSTKSKDSQSNWMKIGGNGSEIKIKNDVLWIKSRQAMLGYLNAENPFDKDGWYNTGDRVEVDGEYYRILGRESEIINVAGEKVFPAEIENFLLTIDNVRDVVVRGKNNPITGKIVWAEFVLEKDEEIAIFKKRVIEKCQNYFPEFKIPRLITVTNQSNFVGSRFKKIRNSKATNPNYNQ
ncbi:MAG: long-chain fatty acid--CoA ligase [Bacteroidales bacterium]|nr:long-chain fatty acid--CoA ligase [Bacteroidales bacterium]